MKKIGALLVLLVFISGCAGQIFSAKNKVAPRPFGMTGPGKNAHPDYLAGWNDGCDTGLSTMVPGYYKSFYKFKQDAYMINNARYYKAWKDSYTYCRQYAFRFVWDSIDQNRETKNICVLCPND